MSGRLRFAVLALVVCTRPLAAQDLEPSGCDTLRWDLSREAAAFAEPAVPVVETGGGAAVGQAVVVHLSPWAEAVLPQKPERPPRAKDSFAGFVTYPAPERPGEFQVTLSSAARVDVVQRGRYLNATAFTGAHDCPGLRKSLRFYLAAEPFTVMFSDALNRAVGLIVTDLETGLAR